MKTRSIGSLSVSVIGIGCNNFGWHIGEAPSREVIFAALDAGITHFDTAELYGSGESEAILSRALGNRRNDVVLASKFGYGTDGTPETIRSSIEGSLSRLQTDRIDLYYIHRPDPNTPIADTLGELSKLVDEGKVREIGCSGFSEAQLQEAASAGTSSRFTAIQNEYSLLHREPEAGMLSTCRELAVAFVPYFPLKSGLLTGKYRLGETAPEDTRLAGKKGSRFETMGDKVLTTEHLTAVERLISFAEARDHTILDLAFAYLLAHEPVVSVIAGATKPYQIHANAAATEWALSPADLDEVRMLLSP